MLFNSPKSCLIYKHSGTTTMGDVAFSHEDTGDDFFFFNFFLGGGEVWELKEIRVRS